jgi:hypothetical protein
VENISSWLADEKRVRDADQHHQELLKEQRDDHICELTV